MGYTLAEAEARQAEILRAAAEGREPDFSEENLANSTLGSFQAVEPDGYADLVAADTIRGPGQEVAEVTVDTLGDAEEVVEEEVVEEEVVEEEVVEEEVVEEEVVEEAPVAAKGKK